MREIKFRAKRIDDLGWAYGYLVKTPITAEFFAYDGQYFDSGWEGRYCIVTEHGVAHEIDIKTVGQYTGLKDKNGEIYEGDILRTIKQYTNDDGDLLPEKEETQVVKWKEEGCFVGFCVRDKYQLEVIGNIYENPELISSPSK